MFKVFCGNAIRSDLVFDTGSEEGGRMLVLIEGPLESEEAAAVRARALNVMAAAFNSAIGVDPEFIAAQLANDPRLS